VPDADQPMMCDALDDNLHYADVYEANFFRLISHIARCESEARADLLDSAELPDGVALLIFDWKMKILAAWFRANQARFFGQTGTSLLGGTVIVNGPTNQDERNRLGLRHADDKLVSYVFLLR
jgi:hypothetical protein